MRAGKRKVGRSSCTAMITINSNRHDWWRGIKNEMGRNLNTVVYRKQRDEKDAVSTREKTGWLCPSRSTGLRR